ncbi:MAG: DUF1064 domain-containing protein [Methanobrevibacter sp.]|nr:DUF1064 domain-containing protein [Methanobrevibacter sp.]
MEDWQYKQLKKVKDRLNNINKSIEPSKKKKNIDNRAEKVIWGVLCEKQRVGEIDELYRKVSFPLISTRTYGDKEVRGCKMVVDFLYNDKELGWVAKDVKKYETQEYKIRKKIFLMAYVSTGKLTFIDTNNIVYKKNESR